MKAPRRPSLIPGALALMVACNNPPTGELSAELVVVQAAPSAGAPGWVLVDTLKVRLLDQAGNPRPGALLTWVVTKGHGSVVEISATTDADGISAALWTLGDGSGLNELRVSALDDVSMTFQVIGEAFRVDRLSSGFGMGCGLVTGAVWCWGQQFWAPTPPPSDRDVFGWLNLSPGMVEGPQDFVDVAVSGSSVCGLNPRGDVWCANQAMPMAQVGGIPPMRRVVGAGTWSPARSCGLAVSDSTAWCWEIGGAPTLVPGSPGFTDLWMEARSGGFTTCGLGADSTAACWGDGPLGDGSIGSSVTPVSVSGGHRFVELAVGWRFACGRTGPGEVWCWGKHDPFTSAIAPSDILNPTLATTGASRISAGQEWAQMISASTMVRWVGAGFSAVSRPTGLSQLPVLDFASNDLACVKLVDGQVYCYDEMWNRASFLAFDNYSPVQPVRRFP